MSRKLQRNLRSKRESALLRWAGGQAMQLGVVLVIIMVIIGLCAVGLITIFGGSNELQNAVDAGNLNVATMAVVGPEHQLSAQEEDQFAGVAVERNGKFYINLGTINRVWGETMAVVLNAQMMAKENNESVYSPEAQRHVQDVYRLATDISKSLKTKLEAQSTELASAYQLIADSNNLRMVGKSDPKLEGKNWETSFYEQGKKKDSNVFINTANQFANGAIQLPTELFNSSSGGYMLGYNPFNLNDPMGAKYSFCFVPLSHEQRPFLVPLEKFKADKTSAFLSPFQLDAVMVPNSFSYNSETTAPSTENKLQKVAAGVSKDVTKGFPIQFPRGFIRVDNDPGVGLDPTPGRGQEGLHVVDHLSEKVVTPKFTSLFGEAESPVLAETIFNPLQVKEGLYIPPFEYAWRKAVVTFAYGLLSLGIIKVICGPFPPPPLLLPLWVACAIMVSFFNGFFVIYGPELVDDGGLKMAMGHTPAVSYNDSLVKIHDGQTREWFSVYASNASDNKLPLMLEAGDTTPIWLGILAGEIIRHEFLQQMVISVIPMDIDIYFAWMIANAIGPDYTSMLEFHPSDNITSGMKVRLDQQLPVHSLINHQRNKVYTGIGSLQTFLGARDNNGVVRAINDAFRRRMRLIKPSAKDEELTRILNDPSPIPLGCSAFIYMGQDGNLTVSVARGTRFIGGAPAPNWLKKFMYTVPDPRAAWREHRFEESIKRSYYRLADPTRDFGSKTKGFPQSVSNDYPSTMKNFDSYFFRPASGYNGLLGALQLQSGVKKVCAMAETDKQSGGGWDMPENCFIDDPMYQGRYGPKE